jgi:hypothetical protein
VRHAAFSTGRIWIGGPDAKPFDADKLVVRHFAITTFYLCYGPVTRSPSLLDGFVNSVVTENSVRSENAEVPIIREILVVPR